MIPCPLVLNLLFLTTFPPQSCCFGVLLVAVVDVLQIFVAFAITKGNLAVFALKCLWIHPSLRIFVRILNWFGRFFKVTERTCLWAGVMHLVWNNMDVNRHSWNLFSFVVWRRIGISFWLGNVLLILLVVLFNLGVFNLLGHLLCSCISDWHERNVVVLWSHLWTWLTNFNVKVFGDSFLASGIQRCNSWYRHDIFVWSTPAASVLRSPWLSWFNTSNVWIIHILFWTTRQLWKRTTVSSFSRVLWIRFIRILVSLERQWFHTFLPLCVFWNLVV